MQRGALVTHLPYTLHRLMYLDLPCDVRSAAHFRLSAHMLVVDSEKVTWIHNTSPTCGLCNAYDLQDEPHVLFHCTHPHVVSLRRTHASLIPSTGSHDASTFPS